MADLAPPLPSVQWVRHARARRLRLRITASDIRLTVPLHCRDSDAKRFLQQHQDWLNQHWLDLQQQRISTADLPDQLQLAYDDIPWQIRTCTDSASTTAIQVSGSDQLDVKARTIWLAESDPQQLSHAIRLLAQQQLPQRVQQLAQQQFTVTSVRVATPRTRWGSCSADGRIMLHAALLLMPTPLADAVIWHELTHLQHRHHQPAFWQALQRLDPQALAHAHAIRRFRVPGWWQQR